MNAFQIRRETSSGPTVWTVGGGKGGVGKSLLASSLAISLARRGRRCALIDLDLGAANLHSLLGVPPPRVNLTSFFERRVDCLEEILTPTPFANLLLAAGSGASLDLANPKYSQKEKLLRHVRALDCEHVVLDLSAGSSFNVLDCFLAGDRQLAVLVPERTSVENTQHFLKAAFFRSLRQVARREPLRSALRAALAEAGPRSARALVAEVIRRCPEAGRALAERAGAFSPRLVVNRVPETGVRDVGTEIALACRQHLTAAVCVWGRLPRDERVPESIAAGIHVLSLYPGSRFAVGLEDVVARLLADAAPEPLSVAPVRAEAAGLPFGERGDPGPYLRACRERLGLSLADLARRTRIRSLASIEAERFDELPSESYVVAFVRDYARILGVPDVEALARCYAERCRAARGEARG